MNWEKILKDPSGFSSKREALKAIENHIKNQTPFSVELLNKLSEYLESMEHD
jgi:hypothetical protein